MSLLAHLGCGLLALAGLVHAATPDAIRGAAVSAAETAPTRLSTSVADVTPELIRPGLAATELRRWPVRGANQGVAVDEHHFYGIGNALVGKYDKRTGERVAEWTGVRGGPVIHLNSGVIQDGLLVLAHSNFPQVPMVSSVEYFDPATVQPVKSLSLGLQHGSLTWAERRDGEWWACFAHYTGNGGTPGQDNRWTVLGRFDDRWQLLESWTFPPQVIATWHGRSCSGGSWGDDGLLYVSGHDARELYVLRRPRHGSTLEYVTTIAVPFEGQAWAWDRSAPRVIYGISRQAREVVVAKIPPVVLP